MIDFSTKCTKIAWTAALYLSFFALGLCIAIPGPTLLDLQQIVQTDVSKVAYIYLSRSSGYLIGSLIGGVLFDVIKKQEYLLIICNSIMGLSTLATPWSRNLELLISILAVGGFSMGALETGGTVLCLNTWGKECAPYYQGLSFVFGLGAFFAPLIAEPFLSNQNTENSSLFLLSSNKTELFINMTNSENFTIYLNKTNVLTVLNTYPSVTYAYAIIGGYTLCVTLLFLILCFICPRCRLCKNEEVTKVPSVQSVVFVMLVAVVTAILLATYCGIEIGYGQMLATFAIKGDLKLTKSIGTYLTAVFWGTFTFARGMAVFLSSKFAPFTLVFSNLIFVLLGSGILLAWGSLYAEFLWTGTVLLAIGLSSFYPSVVTWIEKYIDVTNKIASLYVVAAATGEMVIPLVVSHFMESFPRMLMYIVLACSITSTLLTFILWFIVSRKGEKRAVT